jgi:hypothetical protein
MVLVSFNPCNFFFKVEIETEYHIKKTLKTFHIVSCFFWRKSKKLFVGLLSVFIKVEDGNRSWCRSDKETESTCFESIAEIFLLSIEIISLAFYSVKTTSYTHIGLHRSSMIEKVIFKYSTNSTFEIDMNLKIFVLLWITIRYC